MGWPELGTIFMDQLINFAINQLADEWVGWAANNLDRLINQTIKLAINQLINRSALGLAQS